MSTITLGHTGTTHERERVIWNACLDGESVIYNRSLELTSREEEKWRLISIYLGYTPSSLALRCRAKEDVTVNHRQGV